MTDDAFTLKKPKRALSSEAKCPACKVVISGTIEKLYAHFDETHRRKPTSGEIYQFRSYKKKDFKPSQYQVGYFKNPVEVSGGLPSLGKKK